MVDSTDKSKPMGAMISVRIPEDLKIKFDEVAAREGKYASDILKELIAARIEMNDVGIRVRSTHSSVSVAGLLDEMVQYRQRSAEIQRLINKKSFLFGDPPEYLSQALKFCERKLKEIDSKLQNLFQRNLRVVCPKCGVDFTEEDNDYFQQKGAHLNHCSKCGTRLERKEGKAPKGR